jgi:hypothetical protein
LRRPDDAWVTFPAKKMPGTVTLSHHGVCAGSRSSLTVAMPNAGRSRSGVRNPVAAITSSASIVRSPCQAVPRTRILYPQWRSTRSIDASTT